MLLPLLMISPQASAHAGMPAYLEIKELSAQKFMFLLKKPYRRGRTRPMAVQLPQACRIERSTGEWAMGNATLEKRYVRCAEGLSGGTIGFDDLQMTNLGVLVRIEWLNGSVLTEMVEPDVAELKVPKRNARGGIPWEYVQLGGNHILTGLDHLLFVLGLTLLVRRAKVLVKTITAFTVAHSITLALATLGVVYVPPLAVEAVIALSILFLAQELARSHRGKLGLTGRMPWVASFTFGLFHGLGFAGALSKIGLPEGHVPLALFLFNVGVEIGQLLFVACILTFMWFLRQLWVSRPRWTAQLPAYAVGSIAALWTLVRVTSMAA